MKIAIPISRFDSSGGIRVLSVLANGLAEREYSVSFVVPRGQHEPFFPLDSRIEIHVINPDFGKNIVGGLLKKFQLAFGSPAGVDVAIANAFMTAYSVKISKMLGRTRRALYFVQHYEPIAFGEYAEGNVFLRALKKKFAEKTYHLGLECVSNSRWTAQMLRDKHRVHSSIAPLGVDTNIFRPIRRPEQKQVPVILAIGNANPIKRFDLFVKVAESIRRRLNCRIVVATHDRSLRNQCTAAEFVSPKNDDEIAELYNSATVFVSTSAYEGFGLPLLEAMACGTPVVTTDSGGIRDFCINNVNCRIVQSSSANELEQAVFEICSQPELQNRLVENGLRTAADWNWEKLINSFDLLLQRDPLQKSGGCCQ